jgi:putative SOS response-associated peptidase YedK
MPLYLTNNFSLQQTEQLCKAKLVNFLEWQVFQNVPNGSAFPVITNEFANIIQYFQWGLLPVWAKNIAIGRNMGKTKLHNLEEKTALQAIYAYKRCIIPVTSYTIWADAKKTKLMEHKANVGSLFFLTGLWSLWGEGLYTFSILTQQKTMADEIVDIPIQVTPYQFPIWLQKKTLNLDFIKKLAT